MKLLKAAGEVVQIELQPRYEIVPAYTDPTTGKRVGPTYYVADFRVTYKDGRVEVEDVKGYINAVYKLKKKLVESKYGFAIVEVTA